MASRAKLITGTIPVFARQIKRERPIGPSSKGLELIVESRKRKNKSNAKRAAKKLLRTFERLAEQQRLFDALRMASENP